MSEERRGRSVLDRQKRAAVDELHSVADVMRDAAHRFEEREEAGIADKVTKAADALDRLSATLRERDLEDLLRDAEQGVRTHPAAYLGAAAVAGFALGRFLRAGSWRKSDGRRTGE